MLKNIIFYLEQSNRDGRPDLPRAYAQREGEVERARRSLEEMGFSCSVHCGTAERFFETPVTLSCEDKESGPKKFSDTLFLTDSPEILKMLKAAGRYTAVYSHPGNAHCSFPGAGYLLQEPEWIDADSWQKVYEREAHLPWTILKTERCLVREFVPEDLEKLYELYDAQAERFLTPPGADIEKERQIFEAYIKRIYPLYGFGNWAVISRESGELIGRMGFAAIVGDKEGAQAADATLGYLLAPEYRGRGIAEEVCGALCGYGFEMLGFEAILVEIDPQNTASVRLAGKLGFQKMKADAETFGEQVKKEEMYILYRGTGMGEL